MNSRPGADYTAGIDYYSDGNGQELQLNSANRQKSGNDARKGNSSHKLINVTKNINVNKEKIKLKQTQ